MEDQNKQLTDNPQNLDELYKQYNLTGPQSVPSITPDDLAYFGGNLKYVERQAQANAELRDIEKKRENLGSVIKAESIPNYDGILLTTDTGHTVALSRKEALLRCNAVKDMVFAETGSADPVQVDKDCETCIMIFKAVVQNAVDRGVPYSREPVATFYRQLLEAQKKWRTKSDFKNKFTGRRGKAYDKDR